MCVPYARDVETPVTIPFLGETCSLLTAVCWSASSVLFAAATKRLGSVRVNTARLVLAIFYLVLTILLFNIPLAVSKRQFLYLGASGLMGLALGDSFLFRAFREIGARMSMLIMSTAPAIGAVLAYIFLGEELSGWGILGILVTLTGVAIVVMERREGAIARGAVSWNGVLFGFLGAAGQGCGLIFAKNAFNEGEINGFAATFIRILVSLCVLIPFALATQGGRSTVAAFAGDRKGLLLTAAGSVAGPFAGITLSLVAVANTSVGVAATLMATVPVMMLPLTSVVYRERLTWKTVAGAVLAVGGVAVLFLR